jgi:hypothetical protein
MNYKKHYDLLCSRGKQERNIQEYYEKHHIVPRCMGGSDEKDNLTALTFREHYIAHWLLSKMYPNHVGIQYSFLCMMRGGKTHGRVLTSRMIETIKKNFKIFKRWHTKLTNPGKSEKSRTKARERMLSDENPMKKTPEKNPFLGKSYVKGKRWYNNGLENRYLGAHDIVPEGFVPGMKPYQRITNGKKTGHNKKG